MGEVHAGYRSSRSDTSSASPSYRIRPFNYQKFAQLTQEPDIGWVADR